MPFSSSSSLAKYLHTGLLTEPAWAGRLRPEVLANGVEALKDKDSSVEKGVKDLSDHGAEDIEPVRRRLRKGLSFRPCPKVNDVICRTATEDNDCLQSVSMHLYAVCSTWRLLATSAHAHAHGLLGCVFTDLVLSCELTIGLMIFTVIM